MRYCIVGIVFFLIAFLFPSMAQNSFIEYTYVDNTKEKETISLDRMSLSYIHQIGTKYRRVCRITVSNVFDSIPSSGNVSQMGLIQVSTNLTVGFKDGYPDHVSGPYELNGSMGNVQFSYGVEENKNDNSSQLSSLSFESWRLPYFAFHNGKQISSISGRISYIKRTDVPLKVLSEELIKSLQPYCLDTEWPVGSNDSTLRFVRPSSIYDESSSLDGGSLGIVDVINRLKKLGYVLTSQKGVFPLIYKNDDSEEVQLFKSYILIGF